MSKEKTLRQGRLATAIVIAVLIIDQIIKILVKTNMSIGQEIRITNWFYILFVENNGMAFGMEIISKLFLSVFRIVAIFFFVWYLIKIINKGFPTGYIVTIAFVIAGAAGNLIDCIFYGQIFSESTFGPNGVAHFTPFGEGYAPILYGKVVDMFYFPLWTWPDWLPRIGGNIFFRPIFNFADSCITCGIIVLMLFYSRYVNMGLNYSEEPTDETETDN
ncbi:MAG: lipoprotein signal peptidase [Bacteroidaceae bacterium]|nr:lipoprotein signal peptidase [Bacteroidaceae bacterium]